MPTPRLAAALGGLALALHMTACKPSWERFTAPDESFTVELPGKAVATTEEQRASYGEVKVSRFRVDRDTLVAEVSVIAVSDKALKEFGVSLLFEHSQRDAVQARQGSVELQRDLTLKGRTAHDFRIKIGEQGESHHRLIADGSRLFHLFLESDDAKLTRELAPRMFDSFTFPDAETAGAGDNVAPTAVDEGADCPAETKQIVRKSEEGGEERYCADHQGEREGPYRFTFANGKPRLAGSYTRDQKVGMWKAYREEGGVLSETTFIDDRKSGPERIFDALGDKVQEGNWLDGKKEGLWIEYYLGRKVAETRYKEGLRHGRATTMSEEGGRLSDGEFVKDKHHGRWSFFHRNGQKSAEGEFREGVQIGVWRTWLADGQEEPSRDYGEVGTPGQATASQCPAGTEQREEKTGEGAVAWCERKEKDGEQRARPKGKRAGADTAGRHGPTFGYFPDGAVRFHGTYDLGRKDGLWLFYDRKGKVVRTETWATGELQSHSED